MGSALVCHSRLHSSSGPPQRGRAKELRERHVPGDLGRPDWKAAQGKGREKSQHGHLLHLDSQSFHVAGHDRGALSGTTLHQTPTSISIRQQPSEPSFLPPCMLGWESGPGQEGCTKPLQKSSYLQGSLQSGYIWRLCHGKSCQRAEGISAFLG